MKKVKINSIWGDDYGDIDANVDFYINNKLVANTIVAQEEDLLQRKNGTYEDAIRKIALEDFDKYCSLPKLSNSPKLLQKLYKNLSQSDNEMYYLEKEEWEDYLNDGEFTEHDLKDLKEYVGNCSDYITFDEDDNVVTCYYGLLRQFNDDLSISKDKELDI